MARVTVAAAAVLFRAAQEPAASAGCGVRDREPAGDGSESGARGREGRSCS